MPLRRPAGGGLTPLPAAAPPGARHPGRRRAVGGVDHDLPGSRGPGPGRAARRGRRGREPAGPLGSRSCAPRCCPACSGPSASTPTARPRRAPVRDRPGVRPSPADGECAPRRARGAGSWSPAQRGRRPRWPPDCGRVLADALRLDGDRRSEADAVAGLHPTRAARGRAPAATCSGRSARSTPRSSAPTAWPAGSAWSTSTSPAAGARPADRRSGPAGEPVPGQRHRPGLRGGRGRPRRRRRGHRARRAAATCSNRSSCSTCTGIRRSAPVAAAWPTGCGSGPPTTP